MNNTSPPVSPLDETWPVTTGTTTRTSSYRLPTAAKDAFEQYFVNVSQSARKPQLDIWKKEFGLNPQSITTWFCRRRAKVKSVSQTPLHQPISPVAGIPRPSQPQDDAVDSDKEAAKKDFNYLVEEKILRLLAYFRDRRLDLKFLAQLSEQLGVPPTVIIDFAKWKSMREVQHLANESGTPHSFQNNTSLSPTRLTPTTSEPLCSSSVPSVKMEVDEGAASLPTPQPSVGTSPSPSRTHSTEPDSYASFYDTWLSAKATPLKANHPHSPEAPPSNILQAHLPPSIAQFAFGSSNAA